MAYSFDTQLLSAAKLNQVPELLGETLSSTWVTGVADPATDFDVDVLSFAPDTVALLFNKVTVTQSTSARSLATAPDGDDASDVQATNTLTLSANPAVADGFTINSVVWTLSTANALSANPRDGYITLGANVTDTISAVVSAINGTDGFNTGSTFVTAVSSGLVITVTAIAPGTVGNSITTTETLSSGAWTTPTLTGGVEGGGTQFRVAAAYHGSTFATLSSNGMMSLFTYTSASSAQPTPTITNQATYPEKRRKWLLGYN